MMQIRVKIAYARADAGKQPCLQVAGILRKAADELEAHGYGAAEAKIPLVDDCGRRVGWLLIEEEAT